LDSATEQVELSMRKVVETTLGSDVLQIPPHVLQKVEERIVRAAKKNAAMDAHFYQLLAGNSRFA
jgi:hypothetical protein